ncbi:MAG: GAF domain-containing SpoIIE family protein phosphatase [Candidatus Baltobacteraceae bacterium]
MESVRRYDVLDTPPDGAFDRITALAAQFFDVPIALVTIVDEDRIWFKSRHGLDDVHELPRDPGLCSSAIMQDDVYIVEAARSDPRALANPLVAGEFGLQFYAAAPLKTHDGFNLGTICIIDRQPRELTAAEKTALATFAGIVCDEMELRLATAHRVASEREAAGAMADLAREIGVRYSREHETVKHLQMAMLPERLPKVDGLTFNAVYTAATTDSLIGGDWYDAFALEDGRIVLSVGDVTGHGLDAAIWMAKLRQSIHALSFGQVSPQGLLRDLNRILQRDSTELVVTAFIGILDPPTGNLDYAASGHPPPFLRDAAGTVRALEFGDVPLGVPHASEPSARRIILEPGSLLVLYTDGLTEATRNLLDGEERLRAELAKPQIAYAENPAQALERALLNTGSADDVVIFTLGYNIQNER